MAAEVFILDPWKNVIFPGERHTRQRSWVNAGVITAVVAAGQAPIDVDKRANADIVALAAAKKIIFEPENGTVNIEFRFRANGGDGNILELQMLSEAGIDRYTKVADLTCTQGTQEADDSTTFVDEIVQANNDWETTPRIVNPQANYITRFILNTHGHSKFLLVCTDLGLGPATVVYVDVRRAS